MIRLNERPAFSSRSLHSLQVPAPSLAKFSKSCPDWLVKDWLSVPSVSTPSLSAEERRRIGETIFDAVIKMALAKDGRVDAILKLG